MPSEEYIDLNTKMLSSGPFINFDQADWKQAPLQPIIGKCICGEKSGDYNKDEDDIEATEMI